MAEKEKPLILLVDDEEKFLQGVTAFFADRYRVATAGSGSEALAYLQNRPEKPLVILSDQRMPHMTGLELFEQVTKLEFKHIGRILFTGFGDAELAIGAFNRGLIHNYLQKPFTPDKADLLCKYIDLAADEARGQLRRNKDIADLREAIWGVSQEATIGRLVEGVLNFFRETTHNLLQRETIIRFMVGKLQEESHGNPPRREELDKMFQRIEAALAANQTTMGQIQALFRSTENFAASRDQGKEGFPLHDLVQSALASTQAIIISKEISLSCKLLAQRNFMRCIPADLYYLFVNILLRAASAADFGGKITIESRDAEPGCRITFSDNGPAPSAEESASLFEAVRPRPEYDLSLARKIVEKYDGAIGLEQSAGQTHIVVEFPQAKTGI